MIKPMFGHRPKPRKFNYEFRYHDPKKEERRRRRIKIKRPYKKTHQGRSIILLTLTLAFVVYIISIL